MDKAKGMMEKMGWDSRRGLGKHGSGITKPIRLNHQSTKSGFGFKSKCVTPWWEECFDNAAKNMNVQIPKSRNYVKQDVDENADKDVDL